MSRRTTRRHDPVGSPEPNVDYPEDTTVLERVEATGAVALDKAETFYHKAIAYTKHYYRKAKHYVPTALRHRHPKDYYLMVYNIATYSLWAYLLVLVIVHLSTTPLEPTILNPDPNPSPIDTTASEKLWGNLRNILTPFSKVKTTATGFVSVSPPKQNVFQKSSNYLVSLLHTFIERSHSTYASRGIGVYTILIQSSALLEVLHAALGWVKSPLQTTAMQVASRLLVVWWFVESQPSARTSPFYTTMLISWSLAEMIRSMYYTASLLHLIPPQQHHARATAIGINILTYIRYTAFYVLYPTGAGSEYLLLLKGFPKFPTRADALRDLGTWSVLTNGSDVPAWKVLAERVKLYVQNWDLGAWARLPWVFVWPASLFFLMNYMHNQRQKALNRGPGRSMSGGKLRDVGGKKRA